MGMLRINCIGTVRGHGDLLVLAHTYIYDDNALKKLVKPATQLDTLPNESTCHEIRALGETGGETKLRNPP